MSGQWMRFASRAQLRIDLTLVCGQCFTWVKTGENEWSKVLAGRIVTVKEQDGDVLFDAPAEASEASVLRELLHDYFQLHVDLAMYYHTWASADANFKQYAATFDGLRILRQDPIENVFSFICASCNNIERITLMVHKMCQRYGTFVGERQGRPMHSFPTVEHLAQDGVGEELRALGFGYRARFIHESARIVRDHGGAAWLHGLRTLPYAETVQHLMTLPGVGRKVADCIALFSMDKPEAVPVDTHVWQIATRDYAFAIANKSLTDRVYSSIGDLFRKLHGPYAGWANTVLFAADLKRFEQLRPPAISKVKKHRPEPPVRKPAPEGGGGGGSDEETTTTVPAKRPRRRSHGPLAITEDLPQLNAAPSEPNSAQR